jgi:hypothetical protein
MAMARIPHTCISPEAESRRIPLGNAERIGGEKESKRMNACFPAKEFTITISASAQKRTEKIRVSVRTKETRRVFSVYLFVSFFLFSFSFFSFLVLVFNFKK